MANCQCTGCDCENEATTTDDQGVPVCEECAEYFIDGSEVVCARMTQDGTVCHVCGQTIEWSGIQTGDPGSGTPNWRTGACACGEEAWVDEDRGGWGHYGYQSAEDAAREEAERREDDERMAAEEERNAERQDAEEVA